MENKLTKEYAEKLARQNVIYGESVGNYVFGYLKAIEETNAKELLEALEYLIKCNTVDRFKCETTHAIVKAINAINKATK